jgi:glycosyltransferase involved in cell wall biosynthesis
MTDRKLHIALIADPEIPVPPTHYGGIERIINYMITELQQRGHTISLFAHKDSKTTADYFYPYSSVNQNMAGVIANTLNISRLAIKRPDVIHSFGRLAYLTALLPLSIPKIMSYQREPTIGQIKKAVSLSAKNSLMFTGCSNYIADQIAPHAQSEAVFNCIALNDYKFQPQVNEDAPLVFLGRIEALKGTYDAIQVAKQSGKKLIIAGNIPGYAQAYFNEDVAPYVDGEHITYIGPVNDTQKNELLGKAAALLMPVKWNEPFGIVMAEALACGTPVIGLKGGATTEVVVDGINGFICNDVNQMVTAVKNIATIDRKVCRDDAEQRFSSTVIAQQYEDLYSQMIKK